MSQDHYEGEKKVFIQYLSLFHVSQNKWLIYPEIFDVSLSEIPLQGQKDGRKKDGNTNKNSSWIFYRFFLVLFFAFFFFKDQTPGKEEKIT